MKNVLLVVINNVQVISRDGILNHKNPIIKAILAVISQTKANFCVKLEIFHYDSELRLNLPVDWFNKIYEVVAN